MAIQIAPPSRWSAKHIVLVVTIATLAAVAIAAAISISLAPAHIHFAIANATLRDYGSKDQTAWYYNFTIVVNTTRWRAKVHYAALSTQIRYSQNGWVPAEVNTSALPYWLGPPKTYINVSADYSQYTEAAAPPPPPPMTPPSPRTTAATTGTTAAGGIDWPKCEVEVRAKVWFKFGLALTRPYDVMASCFPVYFNETGTAHAECIP